MTNINNFAFCYTIFALSINLQQNYMKPKLLKVQENPVQSFDIRHEKAKYFGNPWHYHPELELALILESTGTRFVGDSIAPFGVDDLVLIGSNLPHHWQNDGSFYADDSKSSAEAIILRFKLDIWGARFWEAPESQEIKALFQLASKGILYDKSVAQMVKPMLFQLCQAKRSERMWLWIQIFELLAQTSAYQLLSQSAFVNINPNKDSDRINKVLSYTQDHLAENITLETIAGIANMNAAAFCRYFKQQTNKTFIETLNEIRINYACRLLIGSDKDIGQIGFESGFRNVPHFNQVFKAKTGESPSRYKLKYENKANGTKLSP